MIHGRHIKEKYSVLKHLDFIFLDILALITAFILAYAARFQDLGFVFSESWRGILLVCCLIDFMVILFTAPFSSILRRYGSDELLQTLKHSLRNFVICCLALYILRCGPNLSRIVMILTYVLYWIISFFFRMWRKKTVRASLAARESLKTIFVVGKRANMPQLLRSINSGFLLQYDVEGICMVDGEIGEPVDARIDIQDESGGVKSITRKFWNQTDPSHVADYVLQHHIDEVFVGTETTALSEETYRILAANGKEIHLQIQPLVGFTPDDQYITTVGTFKTLTIGSHTLDGRQLVYMTFKRVLDLVLGLLGLLALVPMILVVKICYLANGDNQSIFYIQPRVGLNGKIFDLIKFRSMVCNADDMLTEMLKEPRYKQEWDEKQKFLSDPRITKIGSVLRKTSLDEMPQFLNVLKGDMSVIGPRPLVVGELEQHNGLQMYNDVKPGITGWWGCNGRSNTTYDERLALEYYYVEHCSLYLDLQCFVKTIAVVLKKDGAQ